MNRTFECLPFQNTKLILMANRLGAEVSFLNSFNEPVKHTFLLDTGAIISTMSQSIAKMHGVYDKNVKNLSAHVSGFNQQPMYGRVISIDLLTLGKASVRDVLFFVPDEESFDIAAVLGVGVLNGLVPIPDFSEELIWVYKNYNVPAPYTSRNLGVDISCSVLVQEDSDDEFAASSHW